VSRLYIEALGRTSFTADELAHWANMMRSGRATASSVARSFFFSDEMIRRNLNNDQYVRTLYRAILNRTGNNDEVAYWAGQLNSRQSRDQVFTAFVNSEEFNRFCNQSGLNSGTTPPTTPPPQGDITQFVTRLYTDALGRTQAPTAAEVNHWTNQIRTGRETGASVAGAFFTSDEMFLRGLSNEQYVRTLYLALMGRTPPANDLTYWRGRLDTGITRENVLASFLNSDEFDRVCRSFGITRGSFTPSPGSMVRIFVLQLYMDALGRTQVPSANEINHWTNQLTSGRDTGASVAYAFFFSTEMLNRNLSNTQYILTLYQALFGRTPPANDLAYWTGQLNNGNSRYNVFISFINSDEFNRVCNGIGIPRGSVPSQR